MKGVLQYHFVLPNNESFLRMHKLDKFGDDLSDFRDDIVYVNKTKKSIRGFTQGRTAHAFRNIYPIFDSDGKYLGLMEISFSSDSFQEYLTNVSKIHTHFLVDKKIFDKKTWERDDLIVRYIKSSEHENFMLTLNSIHTKEKCITDNFLKLKNYHKEIYEKMSNQKRFALYINDSSKIVVVSFLPINNISNTKTLAWFVSYEDSDLIKITLKNSLILKIVSFFFSLVFGYIIFKQISARQEIIADQKLVNEVLNSTDNIMFITDFKIVTFSNRKFRDFFNVLETKDFNNKIDNNLVSIFEKTDGYLHLDLMKKNESINTFFLRTKEEQRVVLILDKHMNENAFNINITKINGIENENYLVTLTDITKIKEKENKIKEKAYTDGLTKVYNRNKFDEIFKKEFTRNIRYNRNLSVAIIDIDFFKKFNDTYGHLIGDEVLIMLTKHISGSIRDTDTFARWGGEEFVILLPETSKNDAKNICDKIRVDVSKLLHVEAGNITISIGVSEYEENDTIQSMFKRCDDALYEAKENGRNMVCSK